MIAQLRRVCLPLLGFGSVLLLLSCSDADDGSGGRKGIEGASCTKTDDCVSPYQCLSQVCTDPANTQPPSEGDSRTSDASDASDVPSNEVESDSSKIEADTNTDTDPGDEPPPKDTLEPLDDGQNPFTDCEPLGIASAWSGQFDGTVSYDIPIPIPGAPADDNLPVLGTMGFDIQCIGQKLLVSGELSGLALDTYPFSLTLAGEYNPSTKTLNADLINGAVVLTPETDLEITVLFAGTLTGTLADNDAMKGSWEGASTGTEPAGLPGESWGAGTWSASPAGP